MLPVALTACGSGSSPVAASTTVPAHTTTSTTETRAEASADVLSAYRAMWADLVTAARTSNYQSPLLAQHASGTALGIFVQGLATDQQDDIVTRGQPQLHPQLTSLSPATDPTRGTVSDCFDDTHWVEYKTSGGLAKNTPGGRRKTTAVLAKKDGVWKVTQITVGATGTC